MNIEDFIYFIHVFRETPDSAECSRSAHRSALGLAAPAPESGQSMEPGHSQTTESGATKPLLAKRGRHCCHRNSGGSTNLGALGGEETLDRIEQQQCLT